MFFEHLSQIPELASSSHATIFMVPSDTVISLPISLDIAPAEHKDSITIDQIRNIIELSYTKQTTEQFIVIRQAELLTTEASNALLKLLEEPKPHYHYLLLTTEPAQLLPTILSRANLFILKINRPLDQKPLSSAQTLAFAKRLLTTPAHQLPQLADDLAKIKPQPRTQAIAAVATAIELAYKSYFATHKTSFLAKIPQLITLHQNLQANGNLKLHIVADLC